MSATSEDPTFALAHYRLGLAQQRNGLIPLWEHSKLA